MMLLDTLGWPALLGFASTSLILNLTPGPAVMQVVAQASRLGWRGAQPAILGILAANALYCLLAVLGLGAALLAQPLLFELIRGLGMLYLGWLGLQGLRAAWRGRPLAGAAPAAGAALFRQSFLLQGANPKSVLFFCALLPVFAGQAQGAPLRIALLGACAILVEYPVLLGYALLAARAHGLLQGRRGRRWLDALAGCALLCAACKVAATSLRPR